MREFGGARVAVQVCSVYTLCLCVLANIFIGTQASDGYQLLNSVSRCMMALKWLYEICSDVIWIKALASNEHLKNSKKSNLYCIFIGMCVVRTMGCYVCTQCSCHRWTYVLNDQWRLCEPKHWVWVCVVSKKHWHLTREQINDNWCLLERKKTAFSPLNDTPFKRPFAVHWNVRNFKPNNKWKSSRYWLIHKRCDRRAFGAFILCTRIRNMHTQSTQGSVSILFVYIGN